MTSNPWKKVGTFAVVAIASVALLGGSMIVVNSPGGFNAGLTRTVGSGDSPGDCCDLDRQHRATHLIQPKLLIPGAQ